MTQRTIQIIIAGLFLWGCVSLPEITGGGEISQETESVPIWRVDTHVEKLLESKGWERPELTIEGASDLWLTISGWCAGLSLLAFCGAYLTHKHKLIGLGALLGLGAVVCTGISLCVGVIGWVVGVALVAGLVFLGVKIRRFSLVQWLRGGRDG
jgi:hypothetical protein